MTTKRPALLVLATLLTALFSACSPDTSRKEMPIVNDENCKSENMAQIDNKEAREQFASACLRRGPGLKPSPKKEW